MNTPLSASHTGALYWPVQLRRNVGVRSLFAVVVVFLVAYGLLFPGLFTASGFAKFTQSLSLRHI